MSKGTFGAWTHLDMYYEAKKAYYDGCPLPEYTDRDTDKYRGMGDQAFDRFERGVRSMCRYNCITSDLANNPGYDEDKHQVIRVFLKENF